MIVASRPPTVRVTLAEHSEATLWHNPTGRTANITDKNASSDGDTSREALRAQFASLRRISPAGRLALMDDLTRFVRSMAWQGVRRRNPGLPEAELEKLFFELVLGSELAEKVLEHRRIRLARRAP